MAKLTEIERWEEEIYRIEENDPVHGGENGITNKPTKQLANRTLFLRKQLQLAGQKLVPKKITVASRNEADETGHTHEIERGDTTKAGLMQLTNDTGLESENLGLSAKGGKAIAQSVAQLQQRTNEGLNQKINKTDISDAVNSESRTTVASSKAVKTAYDKATTAEALAQTKQSALVRHRLDLTALDAERYHLVTLTPGSGQTTEGSRWQFQIMRSFSGLGRVAWATHRDGVFSLQLGWSSNRSSWGANAVYRTIEMFEYAWTTQSPVMHIGQLEADSIEYVYLRGGSIYFADAPEGFRVEMQAADFTRNNVTLAASMPFDAARVPLVDIKQAREVVQEAVRQKNLTAIIPNSTVRWDRALPNELPVGTVVGTGQRSQLNLNDDIHTGLQMISRAPEPQLSARFGMNFGRFFAQQAKSATEWGEPTEVVMSRELRAENLNDVHGLGVYRQVDAANATTARNYPEQSVGTLWVSPNGSGVLQEFIAQNGMRYQRIKQGNNWGSWGRVDGENAYRVDMSNQSQNLNGLLGHNKVWGTADRNRTEIGLLNEMYNFGVGLSLNAAGAMAQLYIPHSSSHANNGVWVQTKFAGNNAAPVWRRIDGADWAEVRNKPSIVQNIRMGALSIHRLWRGAGYSGGDPGHVVVGVNNDYNDEADNVFVRPIQKQVNGVWVTISNA